jgi:hypothetical protein
MATNPSEISQEHPEYTYRRPDWLVMQDTYEGERRVKIQGTTYLPATSGQIALGLGTNASGGANEGQQLYDAYKLRANFPNIVQDTADALVGILNREPPVIELPAALEDLRDQATDQGEPLDALLRRIQLHQLVYGRHGVYLDVDESRDLPYLVDHPALRIINWDDEAPEGDALRKLTLTVIDERRWRRDGFRWEEVERYRALALNDAGQFEVTIEDEGIRLDPVVPVIRGQALDFIPFVFINGTDLVPQVGEVPLLGLGRLALTIYRGDADYRQALFMQGQDTLVIVGEHIDPEDPDQKVIVGAGALINLPSSKTEADAKFIGADSQGLPEMREAQAADFERAQQYGLQMMSKGAGAEAAETLKIRVAARTADLVSVAHTSAAGLEQSLKHAATWVGANPDDVKVTPNTDFIEEQMPAAELLGFMTAKAQGAPLSKRSIHALMRKGDVTQMEYDDELEEIDGEPEPEDRTLLGEEDPENLPPGQQRPGDEEDEDQDEE